MIFLFKRKRPHGAGGVRILSFKFILQFRIVLIVNYIRDTVNFFSA